MTNQKIDVEFKPPTGFYTLTNEIIKHGVIHMFIPPVDIVSQWIDREEKSHVHHFDEEYSKKVFLEYVDSLVPSDTNYENDGIDGDDGNVDDQCECDLELTTETEKNDIIKQPSNDDQIMHMQNVIRGFSANVANKVISTILYALFPLYLEDKEEESDDADKEDLSITEAISQLQPKRTSMDIKDKLEEVLFDLVVSLKKDLETENSKKLLEDLKLKDQEFALHHRLLDELMKKYNYESIAVRSAVDRLFPIFLDKMDDVIKEFCLVMQDGVANAVVDMIEEDKRSIPGPQCLE
jgi:hypothetical protein